MRAGLRRSVGCAVLAGGLLASGTGTGQVPEGATLSGEEEHPTIVLPEPGPHWVYIQDLVFPHLIASKSYVLDGDTLNILGMFNTGYLPNQVLSHDKSAVYVAETYWSKGFRGERSDMVTVYDPKTLEITDEIPLPQGRFLIVTKKWNAALTADGRYLLSYNMEPATSISVVDVKDKKYVGEVEIPGCGLVFPTGDHSFVTICPDGSFVSATFDETGEATLTEGEPWFDGENDPVFEHAVVHRPSGQAFFISYDGWVYPVTLKDEKATVGEKWRLQADGEDMKWRPGGWQLAAFHAPTNRLFVLMHEGGKWTHKVAGEEVWVFDTESKQRIHRLHLPGHRFSVAVTQDEQPLLFALSETASISVFDATTWEHKGEREGLGESLYLMSTFGE
jgi:methylamine dehydrogenase heavy chain